MVPLFMNFNFESNGRSAIGVRLLVCPLALYFLSLGQNVAFRFGKKFVFKLGHFQKIIFHTWIYAKDFRLFLDVSLTLEIHFG